MLQPLLFMLMGSFSRFVVQHHRLGFVTFPGPIGYGGADFGGIGQAPTEDWTLFR
jgi:hypothetical protein